MVEPIPDARTGDDEWPFPTFLSELLDIIIVQIDMIENESFNACSLVSRDWLQMSRSHSSTFSRVKLTEDNSASFLSVLQSPFCSVNGRVTRVEFSDFNGNDLCFLEQEFLRNARDALIAAFGSTLTSLEMMGLRFATFGDTMQFICCFRSLEISNPLVIWPWEYDTLPDESVSLPPRLRTLKVIVSLLSQSVID
ncbi:hypothetical protein Hypma_013907 [Hypsizygus marmoreus]|uniref:F-box domain-containing protein n=1 Tax=Hypsizygus marmoreus TaxID=39966 RepID=A0A369KGP1_HYPMA|nr:hypothetical protein Hypma_013907 [Hypsizygus marmoreus]